MEEAYTFNELVSEMRILIKVFWKQISEKQEEEGWI
jgi:hypothetical protein